MVVAECEILDEPDEEDSVEVLRMRIISMAPQRCVSMFTCRRAVRPDR